MRAVHYCHDVLHLDTTEAKEYLNTAVKQLEHQVSRRPVDRKQLELEGKWINWKDAVKGADVLKHRFEEAEEGKTKARACQKYVLYLFFTMLPPGRSYEFATMEIIDQRHHPQKSIGGNVNACIISRDGRVSLRFGDYKTEKAHGVQMVSLSSNEECRERLIPVILAYIDKWRPVLAGSSHSRMFFVKDGGGPYKRHDFSHKIRAVVKEATGVNAGVGILRRSFITHFCGCGSTHRGIALLMRHSEEMQKNVYNMVTTEEEMASALGLASSFFSQVVASPTTSRSCSNYRGRKMLRAVSIEPCLPVKN